MATPPLSPSLASTSLAAAPSDVSLSLDSSDDEAGVFFGPRSVVEDRLISRMVESPGKRRVSGRVRKRDSREMLRRRQTLLVDREREDNDDGERIWDGGFYERKDSVVEAHAEQLDGSAECGIGALEDAVHEETEEDELAARLDAMAVGGDDGDAEEGDDVDDDDEYDDEESWDSDPEGSDKENSIIPEPYFQEEEEAFAPPEEAVVTMGFDKHAGASDDILDELDMGGLRLSDFDDPDTGVDALGDSFSLGSAGTISASSSAHDLAAAQPPSTPESKCASPGVLRVPSVIDVASTPDDEVVQPVQLVSSSPAKIASLCGLHAEPETQAVSTDAQGELVGLYEPEDFREEPNTCFQTSFTQPPSPVLAPIALGNVSVVDVAPAALAQGDLSASSSSSSSAPSTPSPLTAPLASSTPLSAAKSNVSPAPESPGSPLPVPRGGPVVIPSFHMPAASPMRGLAPLHTPVHVPQAAHVATELADLDSPTPAPCEMITLTPAGMVASLSPTKSSLSRKPVSPSRAILPATAPSPLVSARRPAVEPMRLTSVSPTTMAAGKAVPAPVFQRSMKIIKSSAAPASVPASANRIPSGPTISAKRPATVTASVDRARPAALAVSDTARGDATADTAARKAVREQLGAAFAPRLAAFPPASRSASGSSSSSASSSSSQGKPAEPKTKRALPRSTLRQPTASALMRSVQTAAPAATAARAAMPPPPAAAASRSIQRPTFLPKAQPARPAVPAKPRVVVSTRPPIATQPAAPTHTKVAKPLARAEPTVPLKRPLAASMATASRVLVPLALDGARSGFGLGAPARLRDGPGGLVFQEYVEPGMPPRAGLKSPARSAVPGVHAAQGTPLSVKPLKLGTPSRLQVTPRKPIMAPPSSAAKISIVAGAPASARKASAAGANTAAPVDHDAGPRGSSEDREEVSMALPAGGSSEAGSSPVTRSQTAASSPTRPAGSPTRRPSSARKHSPTRARPKRTPKPVLVPAPVSRAAETIVPGMSDKELKATTARHTARNEVYVACAIDTQVVRVPGPRPPSPTSKIPTVKQREDEARRAQRGERARRRKGQGSDDDDDDELEPAGAGVDAVVVRFVSQGPGEDEAWVTPARPAKRARVDGSSPPPDAAAAAARAGKVVSWDKGLRVIRGHYEDMGRRPASTGRTLRSCIPHVSRVRLDHLGNIVDAGRPAEKLKRARVVVSRRFFDGEEAPLEIAASTRSKKKSG